MADVRSMLRSELASRNAVSGKKRKHASEDTPDRKRARNEEPEQAPPADTQSDELAKDATAADSEEPVSVDTLLDEQDMAGNVASNPSTAPAADEVNEDEWARFEREMAELPQSTPSNPLAALNAQAVVEAAPMSAEELAKQARETMSAQKGAKDVEGEEEKEDEARRMEDEFEEMDALEERVRKLRERREALRKTSDAAQNRGGESDEATEAPPESPIGNTSDGTEGAAQNKSGGDESDSYIEEEEDDDDDNWATWGRRRH